jgi:hypothetical protein
MKAQLTPILAGALLLAGTNAYATGRTLDAPRDAAIVRATDTTTTDFGATRDEYMRKAKRQFQTWQERMGQWSDEAKEKGSELSAQARDNLDRAWDEVKTDWDKLQVAAPKSWDKARAAFEEASRRLQRSWQDLHAER